ncbi:MAG TPA: tyrosine-protein phosphatase, partial [Rheinheimera sp.]|nr:tyrosine-protein phosphatase [Rheinheimera sp.]
LPLQGGVNFRDLGGYRTEDGRAVVWGKLFRSGTMSDLTSADYQYLSKLGIKTFCDFRSSEERSEEPTQYKEFAPAAQMLTQDYSMRDMMNDSFTKALTQLKTREQALLAFGSFYRKGLTTYAGQFRDMFAQLLQNKAPLSFNCSAGKDRTGMAAALVLSALGVPRDVVVADYALSEQAYDFGLREIKKRMAAQQDKGTESPHNQLFAQLPRDVIQVFMGTDPALIEAFFQQIEQDYGSVANYLEKEMQLSATDIQLLRKLYLTAKA